MIIVALGHKSRVGKDTFAGLLQTALRMKGIRTQKASFAAKLKQVCYIMYSWDGMREAAYYETDEGAKARYVKLPTVGKTPMEIWIEVGNKIREVFMDTWLMATLASDYPNTQVLIVTDCRFPNEGNKVIELGGIPCLIIRSDAPVFDSPSDKALDDWGQWVKRFINDGTIRDLNVLAEEFAKELIEKLNG